MESPKARFSKRVGEGEYLTFTVWRGKAHPEDEIIRVQLRKRQGDQWSTEYEMSVYRTSNGTYTELRPRGDRQPQGEQP